MTTEERGTQDSLAEVVKNTEAIEENTAASTGNTEALGSQVDASKVSVDAAAENKAAIESNTAAGVVNADGIASLVNSVIGLTTEVTTLRADITQDYPTKREVNRKRRVTFLAATLVMICVVFGASLTTLATVSYCFLQPNGPHSSCSLLPGYSISIQSRANRLQQQAELQQDIIDNKAAIIRLQEEIDALQSK